MNNLMYMDGDEMYPQSEEQSEDLNAGDTSTAMPAMKTALIYLIISIFLAFAGAVYEHFSFGVYSNFMIYAFAIPLVGGTLPFMLRHMRSIAKDGDMRMISKTGDDAFSNNTRRMSPAAIGGEFHLRTSVAGTIPHRRSQELKLPARVDGVARSNQASLLELRSWLNRDLYRDTCTGIQNAYQADSEGAQAVPDRTVRREHLAEEFYHLTVATLTVGSIIQGILAICGRPNSLTIIYLIAGAVMLAASIALKASAARYRVNSTIQI